MKRILYLLLLGAIVISIKIDIAAASIILGDEQGIVAIKAVDLNSGEVIVNHNANIPLIPGSNQKILTLYAALKLLDVKDGFKTSIYTNGKIKDDVLYGDLYIKFRGDPDLKYHDFEKLFKSIKQKGIDKVKGTVFIDDFYYEHEYFGPGWAYDQTKFCWSAPVSSIILNKNCFSARLEKGNFNDLEVINYSSKNGLSIFSDAVERSPSEFCELELKAHSHNCYHLYGCYQRYNLPMNLKIAVQNPRLLAKTNIANYLDKFGIEYRNIEFGMAFGSLTEITSHTSKSIYDYLIEMVKESDNMISESVFKKISADATDMPGSWKNSALIVSDMFRINLTNISESDFLIVDGSGSSRKNLLSANFLTELLVDVYKDNKVFPLFFDTLPVAGKDGTLQYRFKKSPLKHHVFAKTGMLDSVSTLSGYIFYEDKKIAFSLMQNNFTENIRTIKNNEEKFLERLVDSIK